ncbi:MAG: tetratricopeptide repeat protein [Patescibacteria group bacterium]
MENHTHSPKELLADKIAHWSILLVIFLAPIFFIPSVYVPFQFSKVALLFIGIVVSVCVCTIARLKDGIIKAPTHPLFISLAVVPVAYAVSALLSPAKTVSLIGQGFEIGSLLFIAALVFFALAVSYFFSTKQKVVYSYFAFIATIPVVALFQFIRLLFGPNILTLSAFAGPTSTLLGGWNDLGIYFGLAALFSFITLELLKLEKWMKIVIGTILGISLFFLSVISFSVVWYILAGFALIFFVYNFSFNRAHMHAESPLQSDDSKRTVPVVSLIVLIISVFFILLQGNLYRSLPIFNRLVVDNVEVRPSLQATWEIAKQTLKRDPLFGAGPNRFSAEWLTSKPDVINSTVFWGTDFNYGIGLIPTFLVTTGIIGFLSWIVFLVLFLYMGFKALFTRTVDIFSRFILVSSFILSLYLWIFLFFYVPSAPLLILTFFFTGVFMASLVEAGLVKTRAFNFVKDPRTSFASVLVFIVLIIGLIISTYAVGRRFIASVYYNKALVEANINANVEASEQNLVRALQLSDNDLYYRTLTDLNLIKINILLSRKDISQEVMQNQFRAHLAGAQGAAQSAVNNDPSNYQNWLSLGKVYESVVPFNIEGAYAEAQKAYMEAKRLNPKSPSILLVVARLDVAQKDIAKAKAEITEALRLKPDYTDAIFLLSQIQINEGDLPSAIKSVENAAYLNPTNSGVYFQLGLLRYENKDYTGSVGAFEQAITLTPDYANAKYFLGLSYSKLGKNPEAIKQFQELKQSNPDNKEIDLILTNLTAAKDPFAGVQPPLDNAPEDRSRPPLKDDTAAEETEDR